MTINIKKNITTILRQVSDSARQVNRDPGTIQLIAVSKTKPAELIQQAFEAGQTIFGENYVQELLKKQSQLATLPISWHLVGHLQRRKVKEIIGKVSLIHSLDSYELAQEIEKRAAAEQKIQKCLLEINLGGEKTKSGISIIGAAQLLGKLSLLEHVTIEGLMTLPPFFEDPEKTRPYFRQLRQLRDELNLKKIYRSELKELSMGMSHDYPVAIEEGATIIRVGTAVFGERV